MNGGSPYPPAPSRRTPVLARLATVAYVLACLGPLCLPVHSLGYTAVHWRGSMPPVWRAASVLLAAMSPLGALLGAVVLGLLAARRRSGAERARRHAGAAVVVGLLVILTVPGPSWIDEARISKIGRASC